jgi:arylsulfatase A-like enzyme
MSSFRRLPPSTALALAFAAVAAVSCSHSRAPASGADVVLITIDTLRPDRLGCYGHDRPTSPHIDALADQGVRFAVATSTSSWTLPAHASIMTGLHPGEHGVHSADLALPPSARTLAERLRDRGYATAGFVSHPYLGERWGFDQGFDHFDQSAAEGSAHQPTAARVVDGALSWLGRAPRDRPLFVWVHIFDPHWDYTPPAPWNTRFDPDYDGSMDGTHRSLKPWIRALNHGEPPPIARRDIDHLLALYDGEIAWTDHHLGRLLDGLRDNGRWDNTMVVLASDHGEEFYEHGSLEGHQWTLFDEVVLVPWIIRLPHDLKAGAVVERPVSTVSLCGTVLDLLGVNDQRVRSVAAAIDPDWSDQQRPHEALLDLTVSGKHRITGLRRPDFKLLRDADGREYLFVEPRTRGERVDRSRDFPDQRLALARELDRRISRLEPLDDAGVTRKPLRRSTQEQLRALGYVDPPSQAAPDQ